jgi:hypothetical protein
VFLSVPFYAPVEPVVIPAECKQDSSLFSSHVAVVVGADTNRPGKRSNSSVTCPD